jgi:hypothetical protein
VAEGHQRVEDLQDASLLQLPYREAAGADPRVGVFSLPAAWASKIESATMTPLASSNLAGAAATMSGCGLLFCTSSEVVQASARDLPSMRWRNASTCAVLPELASTSRNPLLDLGQQFVGTLERLDPVEETCL